MFVERIEIHVETGDKKKSLPHKQKQLHCIHPKRRPEDQQLHVERPEYSITNKRIWL
jgi:hypothetical protein